MDTSRFFDSYFNNAEMNSMLVMECDGTVITINKSFTKNFGYTTSEIAGRNYSILFTDEDKENGKPEQELKIAMERGQAPEEKYVIKKDGTPVRVVGETMLVDGDSGKQYMVKDVVNLQSKKNLQLFLTETEELLERIFDSSTDMSMMILDGGMKIINVNKAFVNLFKLGEQPLVGSRLAELQHPFWNQTELKKDIIDMLVNYAPIKDKRYTLEQSDSEPLTIRLDSKFIDRQSGIGRKIFILLEEIN
jgi:PAS domain S-box-containing protein